MNYLEEHKKKIKSNIHLKLLLYFHIAEILFKCIYPILVLFNISNNYISILYILLLFGIQIHWNLTKRECIISYLEKKILNSKYILGSFPKINPGISYLFKGTLCGSLVKNKINLAIGIFSYYILPIIFLYIICYYGFKNNINNTKEKKKNDKKKYLIFIFVIIVIYNIYKIYQVK